MTSGAGGLGPRHPLQPRRARLHEIPDRACTVLTTLRRDHDRATADRVFRRRMERHGHALVRLSLILLPLVQDGVAAVGGNNRETHAELVITLSSPFSHVLLSPLERYAGSQIPRQNLRAAF